MRLEIFKNMLRLTKRTNWTDRSDNSASIKIEKQTLYGIILVIWTPSQLVNQLRLSLTRHNCRLNRSLALHQNAVVLKACSVRIFFFAQKTILVST